MARIKIEKRGDHYTAELAGVFWEEEVYIMGGGATEEEALAEMKEEAAKRLEYEIECANVSKQYNGYHVESKMAKIKTEIEVPNGKYCDTIDSVCPMCLEGNWGKYYCCLFNADLEMDKENDYSCIRCDECKQAEAQE